MQTKRTKAHVTLTFDQWPRYLIGL